MAQDPYRYFRVEAGELLEQLGEGVLALERGAADPERVATLLRLAHTLKGAARVVRQTAIAEASHAIEDLLAPARESGSIGADTVAQLLSTLDRIQAALRALRAPDAQITAPTTSEILKPEAKDEPLPVMRADVGDVDALLDGLAEIHARIGNLRRTVARSVAEREVGPGFDELERELAQVRERAERLRLLPAERLFPILARTVRDAAQTSGKKVELVTSGGDIRLDAHVLTAMQSALVQIVKNAAVHGIEPEDERRRVGKGVGRIACDVRRVGDRVVFGCKDDGRGIDVEGLKRAAKKRGVRVPDGPLAPDTLRDLLLSARVSTADKVDEVAGRGIGLDIVRDTTRRLRATVAIESAPGRGTEMLLSVPASLAAIGGLLVETDGRVVALPIDAVRRVLRVDRGDIIETPSGAALVVDDQALAFTPLARLLERPAPSRTWSAIIIADPNDRLVAVGVDHLRGTETIIVRPLPTLAPADPIVGGVALDADGVPRLVLDPSALVARVLSLDRRGHDAVQAPPPILVVDDSLTTRMLEQSILEAAGFDVDTASSAEEGLDKVTRREYGLCLVDVEMPGMDGFGFIERLRADPLTRHIPAILVTSRDAREDLARGEAVGAQGYIVKSQFDQADLLGRINVLLDRGRR